MLPSTLELLRDIVREAEFLESEARRTDQAAFLGNEVLKRAFVRSVEVIGEAAKQVPEDTHPPSRRLGGCRRTTYSTATRRAPARSC